MKSSIAMDIRALLVARLEDSTPVEILRVASALAANEQIEAISAVAARSKPAGASTQKPRFVNLDTNGKPADELGGWVLDRSTGLVWSRSLIGGEYTYADALKACEKVKFGGQACRAPTLEERLSINDYTKHSPALDTAHFAKESGWEWTSTLDAASPSDCAWSVYLGGGGSGRGGQSGRGHVRAVLAGLHIPFEGARREAVSGSRHRAPPPRSRVAGDALGERGPSEVDHAGER
jgi:hypothetical protein